MKLLEIKYNLSESKVKYILTDGNQYAICPILSVSAEDNGDGSYTVRSFSADRKQPNTSASKTEPLEYTHTVREGEVCSGLYNRVEWTYIDGCYNDHRVYEAMIVDREIALRESDDPVIKAQIYLSMGEYAEADRLLAPIIPPDPNHYFFVNGEANRLQAQRYELGLGVEKNLDKAYIHYLYAESFDDLIRFIEMGYGEDVLGDGFDFSEFCEYHFYMLLYAAGEREYAKYRVLWDAGCWLYEWDEKDSVQEDDIRERRSIALCRRQACEWIIQEKDEANVLNGKLTLYLGAYLAYLEVGSEGKVTYVYEDDGSKCRETSILSANVYIEQAIEAGNELAIRGKEFIDSVKEMKK